MDEEPRLRIVFAPADGESASGVTIYMNSAGQLELLRRLAVLGPSNRHVHLEKFLTPAGARDAVWADVVFTEERGDVAYVPPSG